MVLLKIKNGDDLRRVDLEPATYKDLKATLQRLFQVAVDDRNAFTLTYQDDEGDNIGISSDIELAEALHFLTPAQPRPFLRLNLRMNTPAVPVAAPASSPSPSPAARPTPRPTPTPRPSPTPTATPTFSQQQLPFRHPLAALLKDNNLGNLFNMFAAQGSHCPKQQQRQPCTPTPSPTPTHTPIPPCCIPLNELGLDASAVKGIASELLANPEIQGLAQAFGVALPSDSEVGDLVSMFFPQPPSNNSTTTTTTTTTTTNTSKPEAKAQEQQPTETKPVEKPSIPTETPSTPVSAHQQPSAATVSADPDEAMVRNFWGADYDQYDDNDNDNDDDCLRAAAEARLQKKLATMSALGFGNEPANRAALQQAHGNVERAINVLLETM
eukprot:TRINITY_DN133_c0_g1_i2.p1 TRINITY_DN133_c0_g1~~TRINITY_DN133_c0_g1_i2.p1  ORF type:complete len:383 (-),score=110.65 TRINITY_DN133_c0_g1_i2:34-1182(-)